VKLQNRERAIIHQEKLRDYLLSPSHPVGQFKARFFRSLGYTNDNWKQLESDLREILRNDATVKEKTEYGQKYEVVGTLKGPLKTATIVTAWIILKNEDLPRFITAHPRDQGDRIKDL
jgi:hypothetical protein